MKTSTGDNDATIRKSRNEALALNLEDIVEPAILPPGFQRKTFQEIDTTRNLTISVSYPISGVEKIDSATAQEIERQKIDFIQSLDERINDDSLILETVNSDFQVHAISVFKDRKVTSYLFIVSYYHGGAAHPMTMYYSINFDNKTLSKIMFRNYFNISSKADTVFLTEEITKAIGRKGITVTDLIDIDFNIEADTISFNFDDYEIASYAEGIIQGRINRSNIKDRVRATYR